MSLAVESRDIGYIRNDTAVACNGKTVIPSIFQLNFSCLHSYIIFAVDVGLGVQQHLYNLYLRLSLHKYTQKFVVP
jgi:hypothetical protein